MHENERTKGDLTPVMKHFNAKYYRVLVECLRELSLMAADYYKTTAKSYKKCSKRWRRPLSREKRTHRQEQKLKKTGC
jgi:hypothetical protein